MTWRWTTCFSLLLAFAPCALGGQAPPSDDVSLHDVEPTFKLRAERNLVVVRVVVRDSKGRVVDSLRESDFQIFDNGKKQPVLEFRIEKPPLEVTEKPGTKLRETTAIAAPQVVKGPVPPSPVPERFVGFFFDDANMQFDELTRARDAAFHFLASELQSTDRFGVFTSTGQDPLDFTADLAKVRHALTGIRTYSIYRDDSCGAIQPYEAYLIVEQQDPDATNIALAEDAKCHLRGAPEAAGVREPQSAARVDIDLERIKVKARQAESEGEDASLAALRGIESLVRRMASLPGQRSVVIVSSGFLTDTLLYHLDEITDRALRSSVIVNALDARGLYTGSMYRIDAAKTGLSAKLLPAKTRIAMEGSRRQTDGMHDLALSTGGVFYANSNDLDAGLGELTGTPEAYYVLTFSPQNLKLNGAFHPLKVTLVAGKGLTVQARRGYFAPKQPADPLVQERQDIQDAVFSQDEIRDLPIDVHTQFFMKTRADAQVDVLTHLDLHRLRLRKEAGRNFDDLTLVVVLFDRDGHYVAGLQKALELKMRDETLARFLRTGVTVQSEFDVPPGTYLVRAVVRESESGQMSALNRSLEIPY